MCRNLQYITFGQKVYHSDYSTDDKHSQEQETLYWNHVINVNFKAEADQKLKKFYWLQFYGPFKKHETYVFYV